VLRCEINEVTERVTTLRDQRKKMRRDSSDPVPAEREQPQISPGIKVLFLRQQEDSRVEATRRQFRAVGVPIPTNAAQQLAIFGAERDQITAATMIGTNDEPVVLQLLESEGDVACVQVGAVATNDHDFLVAHGADRLNCILQTLPEIAANLAMRIRRVLNAGDVSAEQMDVSGRSMPILETRDAEQSASRSWQRATREIDVESICEN